MISPQCPDCDGDGCARCGQTGVAPAEHSPGDDGSTCRDGYGGGCGRPWRECVCVDDVPDALDVAAGYVSEREVMR